MLDELAAQQPKKPTGFSQDLDYTHERMYRAVCDAIVGNDPYRERLADAQDMLAVLRPTDFPPPLKPAFQSVMATSWKEVTEADAETMVRQLVQLFLDLSEQVLNPVAFGNQFNDADWCVKQAQEGRPEPLRSFIAVQKKQKAPLPPVVNEYLAQRAKKLIEKRAGRESLHPAQKIAIARLMRDRFEFQKHHDTTATLDQAAIYIGRLLHKSKKTINAAYYSVYAS